MDGTALKEQRRGEKAENMVIGVVFPSVRGGEQRACKEVGRGWCGGAFPGGVVTHRSFTFMEEFFIVTRLRFLVRWA